MQNRMTMMHSVDHFSAWGLYLLVLGIILCSTLLYFSSSSDPIYNQFEKVGGGLWDWIVWRPVYENVRQGYERYTRPLQRPFVVNWWAKDYIVLPQQYLAELRAADPKALSFFQNIQDALWLAPTARDLYTAKSGERMVDVVSKGINPRLPHIVPALVEEINIAFDAQLGSFPGEKKINAFEFFGTIASRVGVRLLIGQELCRDSKFLKALEKFTASIFITALIITKSPLGPFRPVLSRLLSVRHKQKLQSCCRQLSPVIEQRLQRRSEIATREGNAFDGLDFVLRTTESSSHDSHRDTIDNLTIEIMHNLWAASSAPGGMMAEVVYQLLARPEYIDAIRREATEAVQLFGWTEKMINKLARQDSFVREVNRLFPTGASVSRTVMGRDYHCADGLTLPVGTRIVFPTQAFQSDPDNFREAQSFDGYRFMAETSNATTMGISNLAWGYGNHMCPGRFLAIRVCKIVLTKLLLDYEIGWSRKQGDPPPRWHVEGQFVPNMSQTIVIRKKVRE